MQYTHSKDKAAEYSKKALERIEKEDLAPIPQNFELWYVYYSGANGDVVRAIDIMASQGQKVTDERCEELHQRFLSQAKQTEQVREAGETLRDTLDGVTGRVHDIKSVAEHYGTSLQNAADNLSKAQPNNTDHIKETVDGVLVQTKDMIKHHVELEHELQRSSAMMAELQRDLEQVRKQALTDGLTNLANRKAFDNEIARITEESNRENKSFSLILMDIDHFKSFNDNFGHQVGDQVLRLVAKTLTDGVKGRDIAARYGGEEFAIILPETDLTGGTKVADSLRKIVQGKELINRNTGDVLGRITLSGGVAEYAAGEKVESIVQRADKALYSAKHNGRNQISSAPAPKS